MAGLYSRIKTWITGEDITHTDLNAEFDLVKTKFEPQFIDDDSPSLTEFKKVVDPGDDGSENLPASLRDELRQLRSMIKKITGKAQWYIPPVSDLDKVVASIGSSDPENAMVSGKVDSNRQPMFLTADGGALTANILGATTDLVYRVANQEYTLGTDETSPVSAGPSSGNTAQISGDQSRIQGERQFDIIILTSVGAEITGRLNKRSAFKTTNGGDTEYFIGTVRDAGGFTQIRDCFRGYFFDSSGVQKRVDLANTQTVTLLKLSYLFINTDGAFIETTDEPFVQYDEPSGASIGQMWFDLQNDIWKQFLNSTWSDAKATFLGYSVQSDTACEGTRPVDFFKGYRPMCDIGITGLSDTEIVNQRRGGHVNVFGKNFDLHGVELKWDSATDMESGSVAGNTQYYLYLTDRLDTKISIEHPNDRQEDLKGFYHPGKPWRCIGKAKTDGFNRFSFGDTFSFGSSSHIAPESLDSSKLQRTNMEKSGSTGVFSTSSISYVDITNLSVTRDFSGRPVAILLVPAAGLEGSVEAPHASISVNIGSTVLTELTFGTSVPYATVFGGILHIDTTTRPGERTYKLQGKRYAAGDLIIRNMAMVVIEL